MAYKLYDGQTKFCRGCKLTIHTMDLRYCPNCKRMLAWTPLNKKERKDYQIHWRKQHD